MRTLVLIALVSLSATSAALAQVSYPMVLDMSPLAVQTGKTSEVEINVRYNLYGAYQVFVSGDGVKGEIVQPEVKPTEVKQEPVQVAAKAADEKKSDDKSKAAAGNGASTKSAPKGDEKAKGDDKAKKETAAATTPAAPPAKPTIAKMTLKFTVAADALPGVRDFRVATAQGVSTLGQLVIVRDPVQIEKNPNDTQAQATAISLPGTACGIIEKNEDVDFFKFTVDKPTSLTFHVRSQRCQDRIHDLQAHSDPLIALRNSTGSVLALSDNVFYADPLLHYAITVPGDYFLEIRDVRYQGNQYWQYSVEINDRPFVTNVHPLAVQAGKATQLEVVGHNLPTAQNVSVTVPQKLELGPQWLNLPIASGQATPAPVYVTNMSVALEKPGSTLAQPQTIKTPDVVAGRIAEPGENDYFAFDAKKGDALTLEVIARRHQSSLDPIIAILNDKGARVIENDDFTHTRMTSGDSCIENWVAPADGRYTIEIRDLHLQGGPGFVYALQVTKAEAKYELWLDSDKTVLAPGTSAVLYVRAARKVRFVGEIQLHVDNVPAGITAVCGKILDGQNDGCIVFIAAKDAKLVAHNLHVRGTSKMDVEGKPVEFNVTAAPYQEIYLPGGGRGLYDVAWHTLSVAEPLDITKVKLSKYDISLKPGESVKIDVSVERAAGFDKNVTLDVMYRHLGGVSGNSLPPGVTLDEKNSKTLLSGTASDGVIVLTAAADAKPVEGQLVPVFAHVAINFVMKMSYSSEPIRVTVVKP